MKRLKRLNKLLVMQIVLALILLILIILFFLQRYENTLPYTKVFLENTTIVGSIIGAII
ncbi:hypothetical protein JXB31_02270 [Candidatus Woesearchaeota archaeon]|nr:hypothetical protein [Candidatus Woesearchaeota archaeon]